MDNIPYLCFIRIYKYAIAQMAWDIACNNIEQAHNLVHNLECDAEMIGEIELQVAAGIVKGMLVNRENCLIFEHMENLKQELNFVVQRLEQEINRNNISVFPITLL